MKKAALAFGLVSGVVHLAMTAATVPFIYSHSFTVADVLGWTAVVLSALFVFFGIRSYRQRTADGRMTFGRGFAVGILISLVASAFQVVTFEILYFKVFPDFGEKWSACEVDRARAKGGSPQAVAAAEKNAQMFKKLFDNPATNALVNFATNFPIGLVAAPASAAILRKR
jgi:ethanolamine transporter EutH